MGIWNGKFVRYQLNVQMYICLLTCIEITYSMKQTCSDVCDDMHS